ncbi:MAG: TPM domain-containing protein [Nanoarchaeota archaeon]
MRRLVLALVLLTGCAQATPVDPAKIQPDGFVTDLADMLSDGEEAKLEQRLQAYKDSTSNEVAVLTVPSLNGIPLEQFAITVAESWGVGREDRDNGVLVLIAKADHEARVEVGLGLEGAITDIEATAMVDKQKSAFASAFREEHYAQGLDSVVDAIAIAAAGEYTGDPTTT